MAGLESGGARGSRLSEALGPPFSRTARYKFRSAIFFMAVLESGGPRAYASAKCRYRRRYLRKVN